MRLRKARIVKWLGLMAIVIIAGPHIVKLLINENRSDQKGEEKKENDHKRDFLLPRRNIPAEPEIDLVQVNSQNQVPALKGHYELKVSKSAKDLKIDWHDYNSIQSENQRKGTGEQGLPALLTEEDIQQKNELYKMNGFNAYISDKISVDRAIKDLRHIQCRTKTYLSRLPNVSVIIPFHNEHWSVLLRSLHSILNRSPLWLIHEIILVDDFSNRAHLKQQLDDHLKKNYNGKVKVIRQDEREGLIRTRLTGARAATGEVLLFLDSHIEAGINWLPPLLEPIAEDYRTVTCPFIDIIDKENFGFIPQDQGARGAFDWQMFYKRLPLLPESLKHPTEPFESPVMAGGLFAISAKWFWELGGYDQGLEIWGGEQYELSFKLWMCGGRMVDTPCSRVGHVYRNFNPFGAVGKGDYVARNHLRVAEVWMDEYKSHVLEHSPVMASLDPGDLTVQREIRRRLKCKSFDWFMKEVAFDLVKHYPPVPPPNTAQGEIRSMVGELCIDTKFKGQMESFGLDQCTSDHHKFAGEQQMELTWRKDIRPSKRSFCFDTTEHTPKSPLILYPCHGQKGNQWWKYNVDTKQLFHPASNQCLDSDVERKLLFMNPCQRQSLSQKWIWSHVNETLARLGWNEV